MSTQPTIYLSPQEVDQIKTNTQNKLRQCRSTSGLPRTPLDPQTLLKQATSTSFLAEIGGTPDPDIHQTHSGTLIIIPVGEAYLPCALAVKDLNTMKLAELQMNTHHRGRKLVLRRVSPVVGFLARSWAVIRDDGEDGDVDVERLEVFLHGTRHGRDVLEKSERWVVKEPYFSLNDQGEASIRIDHPSDLVALHERPSYETAAAAKHDARRKKDEGNTALKRHDLLSAHEKYTAALDAAGTMDVSLSRDIHRNRAHVNLLLGCFKEAKHDAEASIIRPGSHNQDLGQDQNQRAKELDAKAYFRAGYAAYHLGEYQEAKTYFTAQKALQPTDKSALVWLRKVAAREREQAGVYDFHKVRGSLLGGKRGTDVADLTSNTAIQPSAGKGRGLFATCSFSAGETVMCERAFCVVWGGEDEAAMGMTYDIRDDKLRLSPLGLTRRIVRKLLDDPSRMAEVMDLYGDWQGDGVFNSADGPVVDVFRVHDIVSRNAFSLGIQYEEADGRNGSAGLWRRVSYINHSCIPNLEKTFIGDLMVLRATQSITVGEELFISYDELHDYDARQAKLMDTWGFECECRLCKAEKADGWVVREKRRELVCEVGAVLEREMGSGKFASRLAIAKGKRLARTIDETYDGERYMSLPRVAGQGIKEWLAKVRG